MGCSSSELYSQCAQLLSLKRKIRAGQTLFLSALLSDFRAYFVFLVYSIFVVGYFKIKKVHETHPYFFMAL